MRIFIFLMIVGSSVMACKSKKAAGSTATNAVQSAAVAAGATTGKVSHQYRANGCATVILVSGADGEMVLIPKDPLPKDLDVDGAEIRFNYHTLKMPQPAGCASGIPAELTDISKK